MKIRVHQLSENIPGCWLKEDLFVAWRDQMLCTVSIDSWDPGSLQKVFFAIKGQRLDGHDFVWDVLKKDVGAIVVCSNFAQKHQSRLQKLSVPMYIVEDTLKALQQLARYWRRCNKWKLIGITGSVGKTTTKHFCQILLSQQFKVGSSPKSFNNHYGVPLALLSASEDLDFFIQEIGMNQKGEIAFLTQLVEPDIVVVSNIGSAHIGLLGSLEAIAKEKEQIYLNASSEAILLFNIDNIYTKAMYEKIKQKTPNKKMICFSAKEASADVFLQVTEVKEKQLKVAGHIALNKKDEPSGSASFPICGEGHLYNLMGAAAVGLAAGMTSLTVWKGLALCHLPSGRNQWVKLKCGARALFDAYNASRESALAFLDYFLFTVRADKKILILGDFLEMGDYLEKCFQELADKLLQQPQKSRLSFVYFIGSQSALFQQAMQMAGWSHQRLVRNSDTQAWANIAERIQHNKLDFLPLCVSSSEDLYFADKILAILDSSFVLALKASRKAQLERVLTRWQPVDFHAL